MRSYQQLTALIFAAIGVFMAIAGYALKLQGDFGPGPGFMAFLVGLLLCAVSLLWLVNISIRPSQPFDPQVLPEPGGGGKVAALLIAVLTFAALLTVIGFRLSMFMFLVAAFLIFGRDHLAAKCVVAVIGSFGLDYVFERLLRVPLPDPAIESLSALGF
jgi:vacuolar-type H+-ATPase subunit I/STV1